jgi:putative addiction module component (TIGR02574 family)
MSDEELRQLLSLPLPERIDLAQALWQSIHEEPGVGPDEERQAVDLARTRDAQLASGAVPGRTHEQVMEAARRALEWG